MGYRLNRLDEPVFIAVLKPLLTEFGIDHRLESCVLHKTSSNIQNYTKFSKKSTKPLLQWRGEKSRNKRQKIKKIRQKLIKCEKAENQNVKFKILVES